MRTNIVIDDALIEEAMKLSHSKTKKQVVELALENLIKYLKRQDMRLLFGKIKWEGNLEEMRKA